MVANAPQVKRVDVQLRGGLDPNPPQPIRRKKRGDVAAQARVAELLKWLISEWWAYEVALRGMIAYLPATACTCRKCRNAGRRWPSTHVGSVGVSYDCFLERQALPHVERARMTEGEALSEGLTIIKRIGPRAPKPAPVLVAGCEMCEGLRVKGDRYCLACWEVAKADYQESE